MKTLIFLLAVSVSGIMFASESPAPVKAYCFSADLEAGFKDAVAEYVCRELGNRGKKKKSLSIVGRDEAQVFIQFLGTEQVTVSGETTYLLGGYAWNPDQLRTGARTVISIGDYRKGFHAAGMGAQATAGVAWKTEEWIRENREVILQKARKK
jgi:hypothetical protein